MKNIISVNGISFSYVNKEVPQNSVLSDISLEVKEGEFLSIIGHNGSGKSTLAKMFNGLLLPDSGDVIVNGINTKNAEDIIAIRRTVGMVFQNPDNQFVASIVKEDVAFGPENLGFSPEESENAVYGALNSVDMLSKTDADINTLSGGQKQRVAIAGVLAMSPMCIVLDESTAMLDPVGREEVLSVIRKINKEQKITVILITHFMEEAVYADRIAVMNNGSISAIGTPNEIFQNAKVLSEAGIVLPDEIKLVALLHKKGVKFNDLPLTKEDCLNSIKSLFGGAGQ